MRKNKSKLFKKYVPTIRVLSILLISVAGTSYHYKHELQSQAILLDSQIESNLALVDSVEDQYYKLEEKDLLITTLEQQLEDEIHKREGLEESFLDVQQENESLKSQQVEKLSTKPKLVTAIESNKHTFLGNFNTSAYTNDPAENGGYHNLTAKGTQLRKGVVAVDPKVIPLGTKLYIEYADGTPYGYAIAEDTGGAIKGQKMDIFIGSSKSAARSFGRQSMRVYKI